jgi:hypothetical protein
MKKKKTDKQNVMMAFIQQLLVDEREKGSVRDASFSAPVWIEISGANIMNSA